MRGKRHQATSLLDTPRYFRDDAYRNVVSIRVSQDLFDDLSANPTDWEAAIRLESHTKPRDPLPALNRAFEKHYLAAIDFPFSRSWTATRYSDGSFGVWYGSPRLETTVFETVYHFCIQLKDAGFDQGEPVIRERKVYRVEVDALVFDLRGKVEQAPDLVHPSDYRLCQSIGLRIRDRHAGLITRSARCDGDCLAIFAPRHLSDPRLHCYLTYIYEPAHRRVRVQRQPGRDWLRIASP
ncbi:RES family NAD+ phosphorylase [Panacagrimonas sp.]|uniref:RES family NAD+ phosphorylase n=1 Tax=Panacagrimonas sp. TaxID=2480088 RepID=UPI003B51E845